MRYDPGTGKKRLDNRVRVWGPAAGWAAVLFLLSAAAGSSFGPSVRHLDKVAHFGLYMVLGAALARVRLIRVPQLPHALLIALGVLYGVSDEFHQSFVPGRTPDVRDWVADALGVLVGYGLFLRWRRQAQGGDPEELR